MPIIANLIRFALPLKKRVDWREIQMLLIERARSLGFEPEIEGSGPEYTLRLSSGMALMRTRDGTYRAG
ncbi:hypothetical protein [uncultured Rhodoblastus sp.]|uniref:hypothetical protein n=1 Tax=uncultured Rhodoblastus sp. TaxID=543037 RepID=UPI0025CDA77E|nr:hypothetical protein [uncultured Rhodoblastus sp.]